MDNIWLPIYYSLSSGYHYASHCTCTYTFISCVLHITDFAHIRFLHIQTKIGFNQNYMVTKLHRVCMYPESCLQIWL